MRFPLKLALSAILAKSIVGLPQPENLAPNDTHQQIYQQMHQVSFSR